MTITSDCSAALSETSHHQRLLLDANLASANLTRMHTARGYGPAWGFSLRDVMKLERHFSPPLF